MSTDTLTTAGMTRSQLTGSYEIDQAHSRFGFVARHAMITKVRGQFNDFAGTLRLDGADPASSEARLTIEAASIDTRNPDRDGHLRSNDFLAMEDHPEILFETTGIDEIADDRFSVSGDLTIRGTTRPVTFDVAYTGASVDPYGNTRVGFEGSTTINRKDWGVNWNAALEAGGVLVSEKVDLEFEISAIKTA